MHHLFTVYVRIFSLCFLAQIAFQYVVLPSVVILKFRVIRKSLRGFRPPRYSSRDGLPKGSVSTEGETLQVSVLPYRCSICPPLGMRHVNPVIKFLPHTCNMCGRNVITGLTSEVGNPGGTYELSCMCV